MDAHPAAVTRDARRKAKQCPGHRQSPRGQRVRTADPSSLSSSQPYLLPVVRGVEEATVAVAEPGPAPSAAACSCGQNLRVKRPLGERDGA